MSPTSSSVVREASKMRRSMVHPETGEKLTRGIRRTVVSYRGLSRVVDLPGWYPAQQDGDGVLEGADMERMDEALREMKAEASLKTA